MWPQLAGAVTHVYRVKSKAAGFATGAVNRGQGGYPVSLTSLSTSCVTEGTPSQRDSARLQPIRRGPEREREGRFH